jgi:hypothetical protein
LINRTPSQSDGATMFRQNEEHRQQSFFSGENLLPDKLRARLRNSWAETFYHELFCRIDETLFAPLFSKEDSRPNSPVNVLMGAEILKSGFGWSDEELYDQVCFDLQVRHALGLRDLGAEVFVLRTLYYFRQRVRDYAAETGVNLIEKVFEQVTDAQLETVKIATGWQRMDSTQVLSNLAKMTRLQLLVSVLQKVHRGLPTSMQDHWGERWQCYLDRRPHQVCYRVAAAEVEGHLLIIGEELGAVEVALAQQAPESEVLSLVRRVLDEQYIREPAGEVTLRPEAEVASDSLQSPHDPDATYRVKGGATYCGGYVVNVSETADPQNPVQLITDLQVEPNRADDAHLLKQSLDDQVARGIDVKQVTTDGGYTGPQGQAACDAHRVILRATRMRGGCPTSSKQWGCDRYLWENDSQGIPVAVTCPAGHRAALFPGRGKGCFLARFDAERCAACQSFRGLCRVKEGKRVAPTLYVLRRRIESAQRRQRLCPQDGPIRALVESTVRSLKRAFPGSKLPVRGLIRARMVLYPAALMVNLRRLHRHFEEKAEEVTEEGVTFLSLVKRAIFSGWASVFRPFSMLSTPQNAWSSAN